MAIAAGSSGGSAVTGRVGGSDGLRYRALKYVGGNSSVAFNTSEEDLSSTPLKKFDLRMPLNRMLKSV